MASNTKGRKLNGRVFIHPGPDDPPGTETVIYEKGDIPSAEDAARLGDHVWAPEEVDDDDGNAFLRDADTNLRQLLVQAEELGITPGNGMPRNPSREVVARAIRFAQGRATGGEPQGATPAATEVNVADEVEAMAAPTRERGRSPRSKGNDDTNGS